MTDKSELFDGVTLRELWEKTSTEHRNAKLFFRDSRGVFAPVTTTTYTQNNRFAAGIIVLENAEVETEEAFCNVGNKNNRGGAVL